MTKPSWNQQLTRRERQVIDILLSSGENTASEIHSRLPDSPTYSAVRALLRVMEQKGVITHRKDGPRYIYKPKIAPAKARQSMLKQVLESVFQGSRAQLVSALLDPAANRVDEEELDRLVEIIEKARRSGQS